MAMYCLWGCEEKGDIGEFGLSRSLVERKYVGSNPSVPATLTFTLR